LLEHTDNLGNRFQYGWDPILPTTKRRALEPRWADIGDLSSRRWVKLSFSKNLILPKPADYEVILLLAQPLDCKEYEGNMSTTMSDPPGRRTLKVVRMYHIDKPKLVPR
jgi:hypothetical protein